MIFSVGGLTCRHGLCSIATKKATQLSAFDNCVAKRTLLQVSIEDAVLADEVFSMLMGDKVAPRREFIEENATYVRNLDI